MKRSWIAGLLSVLILSWGLSVPAAAGEGAPGQCVSECTQYFGGSARALCALACGNGMVESQCTWEGDGCCSEFFRFADPDCDGGSTTLLAERLEALEALTAQQQVLIEELQARLAYLRIEEGVINGLAGPHVILEGANLHLRSGSGGTEEAGAFAGLGNLVIGYNEEPPGGAEPGTRSGSHNIVSGVEHRYPSYGGLVTGEAHRIMGEFSAVIGGWDNSVLSWGDVIVGGGGNTTEEGCILGGSRNHAAGRGTIVGGYENNTEGRMSSVVGGRGNLAAGAFSTATGGAANSALGSCSTVGGGLNRVSPQSHDWAAGALWEDQ